MSASWSTLEKLLFTPADVETLTDVSTSLQRKWVQLYLKSADQTDTRWVTTSGGQRRFTWSGLQFLVFFRDVTRDVGATAGTAQIEGYDEEGSGLSTGPTSILTHSDIFRVDHRARSDGDLFVFRSLVNGAPNSFLSASLVGANRVLNNVYGARLYIYNLSAMQRSVAEQACNYGVEGGLVDATLPAGPARE